MDPTPVSRRNSPLVPLAWGFLAIAPLPLIATFFTEEAQSLERTLEYSFAAVLFFMSGLMFLLAHWDSRRNAPGGRR